LKVFDKGKTLSEKHALANLKTFFLITGAKMEFGNVIEPPLQNLQKKGP